VAPLAIKPSDAFLILGYGCALFAVFQAGNWMRFGGGLPQASTNRPPSLGLFLIRRAQAHPSALFAMGPMLVGRPCCLRCVSRSCRWTLSLRPLRTSTPLAVRVFQYASERTGGAAMALAPDDSWCSALVAPWPWCPSLERPQPGTRQTSACPIRPKFAAQIFAGIAAPKVPRLSRVKWATRHSCQFDLPFVRTFWTVQTSDNQVQEPTLEAS